MQPFALAALWIALLLCSPVLSSASNSSDATDSLNLAQLSQQVQELSQLLSQVVGAEPVDSYGSSLLPSSSITQRLIARQPELWPHQFTFLSAVAADSSITCSHVLSNKAKHAGAPLYVVLGDQAGRLYFFTPQGTLLFEHDTGVSSSVTALSSDLVRHNDTHLLVGQADGTISVLSVAHEHPRLPDGSGVRAVVPLMVSTAADRAQHTNDTDSHAVPVRHIMFGMSSARRTLLAVDAAGRVLLLAANSGRLMMAQTTLSGPPLAVNLHNNFQLIIQGEAATSVLLLKRGRSRVTRSCAGLTAATLSAQQQPQSTTAAAAAAAASEGVGSSGSAVGEGLEYDSQQEHGDRLVAAVFDPQRAFRVFGVTAGGELVVLMVPSGMAAHTCKVLQHVPLGLGPGPVHLVMGGKGRLILLHAAGVAAFSVSLHKVQLTGSYLVSHTWQQLWRVYGLTQQYSKHQQPSSPSAIKSDDAAAVGGDGVPLHSTAWDSPLAAATANADLLLLPFGSTGLATFAVGAGSNTPLGLTASSGAGGGRGRHKSSGRDRGGGGGGGGSDINWVKAVQPLVVVMMIVVGVWQFVRASNRSGLAAARAGRYGGAYERDFGRGQGHYMSRAQGMAAAFAVPGELAGGAAGAALLQQQRRAAWDMGEEGDDYNDLLAGLGSSSYERELGPYAGPRSRRDGGGGREQLGAGLGLTARRRARAAMFTNRHAQREQAERERLLAQQQQQQRRRGQGVAGAAAAAAAGVRGAGVGASAGSSMCQGGMAPRQGVVDAAGGAEQRPAGRSNRVTFEDDVALQGESSSLLQGTEQEDEVFLSEAEQQLLFQQLQLQQQQEYEQQEQQVDNGSSGEGSVREQAAAGAEAVVSESGQSPPPVAASPAADSAVEGEDSTRVAASPQSAAADDDL